jgi:hypothetical protein
MNCSGIRSSYTTNNRHNLTNSLQIKSEPMMLTAFNGAAADIVEKTAAGHHAAAAAAGFFKLERRRGTDSSAATDGPPALNLTAASQQQSSSLSSPYAQPEQKLPMLLKQVPYTHRYRMAKLPFQGFYLGRPFYCVK